MKLISSLMLPAAKKFYGQAGLVVSQNDLSGFIETLFRKQNEPWSPFYTAIMYLVNEAAKSQGYTIDDKWVNTGLAQWEGPKNFEDIIVLNKDELMVIYPCRKGVDKEAVIWWLRVLFGTYPFLQERIGASKKQIAVFLRKRYFPKHISGCTYPSHVRISTFQRRWYQILVALHELGHTLLVERIGRVFIDKQWPEGKGLPEAICFFSVFWKRVI